MGHRAFLGSREVRGIPGKVTFGCRSAGEVSWGGRGEAGRLQKQQHVHRLSAQGSLSDACRPPEDSWTVMTKLT